MKYLKYIGISQKLILSATLTSLVLASCTKNMEGLNEDKKLITDKMLEQDANEGGYTLPGMQLGIVDVLTTWRIEMQQNLNADNYGGYMSLPSPFYDNKNNGTYFMVQSWNDQIWLVPSSKVLDQWLMMKKKGFDTKYPDLYAMALIFKVFAGHRLVDVFGPLPYSLYGTASEVKFDSEEEAYNLFFEELRKAVADLTAAETADPNADKIRYARFDKSRYGGNYATWIKVANTLRLRLAIRISRVNPAKAKTEAEAAINDGGLLEGALPSFEMSTGTVHPLLTITRDWNETRLNAAVETILKGYGDPRLPKYALPAGDPALGGEIKGLRSGAAFGPVGYNGFSQVNFVDNNYVKVMDVAESYFLRAEGALRGWNMGGTAQEFYEAGIRASFNANKVGGVDDYINDNTSVPIAYVDPYNAANNAPAITNIKIKWDEGASFNEKLERIITQKWIAMYPDGQEAWSEFRRTGYPKLWPVTVNLSGGDVPVGEFIKRINYPPAITNASQAATAAAVASYLDGKDKLFTPLWWDID
ncbi:MAG: SusD/RagB family nutrient-binding outer membrane lipoprotein [Chitinophagaceae bacterium]|nr:SusD/RagB family nutrient-binding outer membrane lipoprotein [Chitinophagaceae bacterium]